MWTIGMAEESWKVLGFLGPADIAVIVVMLLGLAIGFWTGLIWQLICLGSVIACFYVSYTYHPIVADWLGGQSEALTNIGAAMGVFVAALIVCYLVSFLFRGLINAIRPQLADRVMGSIFGLVVGALLVGIVAFFLLEYSQEDGKVRSYVQGSKGAKAMATVVRAFVYVLPEDVIERIAPSHDVGSLDEGGALPDTARTAS